MKWTVKPSVEFRRLGEEGVAMDVGSGKFYRLSPEAADCFEAIAKGCLLSQREKGLDALIQFDLITTHEESSTLTPQSWDATQVTEYQAFTVYASHCGTYTTSQPCNAQTGVCKWTGACGPIAPHPANK